MAVIEGKYGTAGVAKPIQLGVFETSFLQLIGPDEQIDQNDYTDEISAQFWGSGEILGFNFFSAEDGAGDVQEPTGKLLIFNDAVSTAAGDTSITVAERADLIGIVQVNAADWQSDANGASVYYADQPVAFPRADSGAYYLYFVWFHEDAVSYNDGAGDDEYLMVKMIYRLDHRE